MGCNRADASKVVCESEGEGEGETQSGCKSAKLHSIPGNYKASVPSAVPVMSSVMIRTLTSTTHYQMNGAMVSRAGFDGCTGNCGDNLESEEEAVRLRGKGYALYSHSPLRLELDSLLYFVIFALELTCCTCLPDYWKPCPCYIFP